MRGDYTRDRLGHAMLFVMFEAKMPKFDLWLQQLELHNVTSTLTSSATT